MKEILFIGFQLIFLCNAFGHGDLHKRIVAMSEKIDKDPSNPNLYFKRGRLYQQHDDFTNSLADYLKAESLGFNDKIYTSDKLRFISKIIFIRKG